MAGVRPAHEWGVSLWNTQLPLLSRPVCGLSKHEQTTRLQVELTVMGSLGCTKEAAVDHHRGIPHRRHDIRPLLRLRGGECNRNSVETKKNDLAPPNRGQESKKMKPGS